jgi:hypothetical protein
MASWFGLLVTGTKLLWNGWIMSEAVGGGEKNDGKNEKNDGIQVKKLAAACHGISVTSNPKYLGLWLALIPIKNRMGGGRCSWRRRQRQR